VDDLNWTASELEYVEIDVGKLPDRLRFYRLTPIVLCSNCGIRYTEDHTRDGTGAPLSEEELDERDREPRCWTCIEEAFGEALEKDTLDTIERKLGLTEENKKTLEALMSIIDNPDRVMMVARVQERVDELERRLEDRVESLRDLAETKLDSANSRLFVTSLITNAALFAAGVLGGIVVALVLGG
jgi:tetrahydromethanopterin S-methyltransferase subunit B